MSRHVLLRLGSSVLCAVLFGACRPLPEGQVESSLYTDVYRVVRVREEAHWGLDRVEIEAAASTSADAICSADEASRANVARWLDERISLAEEGSGAAVRARRVRAVLRWWDEHESECEGVAQARPYRGIHGNEDRFVLLFDTVAMFNVYLRESRVTMGPSLGVRIMPAFGFGRYTFAFGLETASFFEFRRDIVEDSTVITAARAVASIPFLFRVHDLGRVWDFEVALTTRLKPSIEPEMPPGVRVFFGFGVESLRSDSLVKTLVYGLSYELNPARNGWPMEHIFRIGTRIGTSFF